MAPSCRSALYSWINKLIGSILDTKYQSYKNTSNQFISQLLILFWALKPGSSLQKSTLWTKMNGESLPNTRNRKFITCVQSSSWQGSSFAKVDILIISSILSETITKWTSCKMPQTISKTILTWMMRICLMETNCSTAKEKRNKIFYKLRKFNNFNLMSKQINLSQNIIFKESLLILIINHQTHQNHLSKPIKNPYHQNKIRMLLKVQNSQKTLFVLKIHPDRKLSPKIKILIKKRFIPKKPKI